MTIELNPSTNESNPTPATKAGNAIIERNRKRALELAKAANERAAKAKEEKASAPKAKAKAKAKKVKTKTEASAPVEAIERPDFSATKVDAPVVKRAKGKKAKAKPEKAKKEPKAKLSKAEKAAEAVQGIEATDVVLKSNEAPAIELASELHTAFDHFNKSLFANKLAPVMFSNVRLKKSLGHHWPKSWARRKDLKGKLDEIGMDFTRLREEHKGDKEVLSTLVHEMCHQLVSMLPGKPERGHGHKWVAAMNLVGLEPIILDSKGVPTGKATGPNSSHKIVEGGDFDKAADELLSTGFKFSWFNEPMPQPEKKPSKKKKAGAKAKHTCPSCQRNAWGAPSLHLYCKGDPEAEHDLVEMDCDRGEYEGGDDQGEGGEE